MISTAGIARNGEGAYFIAKRKPSKNLNSCWEFPGGKVDDGENPEEALKREYLEEFGVKIEVGDLLCRGSFSTASRDFTLLAYSITLTGIPECREHSEYQWKSLDDLEEMELVPSDRIILENLQYRR